LFAPGSLLGGRRPPWPARCSSRLLPAAPGCSRLLPNWGTPAFPAAAGCARLPRAAPGRSRLLPACSRQLRGSRRRRGGPLPPLVLPSSPGRWLGGLPALPSRSSSRKIARPPSRSPNPNIREVAKAKCKAKQGKNVRAGSRSPNYTAHCGVQPHSYGLTKYTNAVSHGVWLLCEGCQSLHLALVCPLLGRSLRHTKFPGSARVEDEQPLLPTPPTWGRPLTVAPWLTVARARLSHSSRVFLPRPAAHGCVAASRPLPHRCEVHGLHVAADEEIRHVGHARDGRVGSSGD
jgi:hypothetical protein